MSNNKITGDDIEIMRGSELSPEMQWNQATSMLDRGIKNGYIPYINPQQKQFITFLKMGMPVPTAQRGAGMTDDDLVEFTRHPNYAVVVDYMRALNEVKINVTKDLLTMQYYEAIAVADTSGEKIRGLDSIAKLHEIGGFARPTTNQANDEEIEQTNLVNAEKKMRKMSDAALAKRAGMTLDLEPEAVRYDDDEGSTNK